MDTLFIGQKIIRLSMVDSTNSYAIAMLKDVKVLEGTMILADQQTNGRGQRGSTWESEPLANITCSLIISPTFLNVSNHFLISKIIALSIFKALSEILPSSKNDIKIKWPNDILVNNKKIAGVLIENIYRNNQLSNSVIGFGINVNQENFHELAETACSIKTLTDSVFEKQTLLNKVAKQFEVLYLKLKSTKYAEINEEYLQNLFGYNKSIKLTETATNKKFIGVIENVLESGEIIIRNSNSSISTYELKQIKYVY